MGRAKKTVQSEGAIAMSLPPMLITASSNTRRSALDAQQLSP
jgi:hypothetical protein